MSDHPEPVSPPVAPVAAIRASASESVVQVIDVPGELTRGSAAQVSVAPQDSSTNEPDTHCANEPCTHAFLPSKGTDSVFMHDEDKSADLCKEN